jgi:ATP-dependent protease ClpP protease subunit
MLRKNEEDDYPANPASNSSRKIYREGNNIFFYDNCDVETAYLLEKNMREIYQDRKEKEINIVIDSQGGHLCGMYDFLKAFPLPVIGWVQGYCCSAATTVLLGCRKRNMSPSSFLLIHGYHGEEEGDINEGDIQDSYRNIIRQNKILRAIYTKETKIPPKELDLLIRDRDQFLTAQECKKWKIIDEIATFVGV